MTVVRFPEFWTTAQTLVPSVETARGAEIGQVVHLDRVFLGDGHERSSSREHDVGRLVARP